MSNIFKLCLPVCFLLLSALNGISQVIEKVVELRSDTIVFPITLISVYPFISGTVNGVTGKFMFDTGYETSIALNDNYLDLPNKKIKGSSVTGSGQSFKTHINDNVGEIKFPNGLVYRHLDNITSGNYDFLQKYITPDCIGYIGHDFFGGYLFKLDYLHSKVTFYKATPERRKSKDFLKNEKVVAILNFEIRKLVNHPLVKLTIDGINVIGTFDTGQNGTLQLDTPAAKRLKSRKTVLVSGVNGNGDTLHMVKKILIDGNFATSLKGLELADQKAFGTLKKKNDITESNLMTIGYRFLSQFKTVWDYSEKKIYILEY